MSNILKLIQERHTSRVTFDCERPVAKQDLKQILEAGRWAPTAHNMQNFDILVIDDKALLEKIGNIKSQISGEFIRENYQQLSFSEKELLQKKVGILGTMFPPSWRDPSKFDKVIRESGSSSLQQTIRDSPVVLMVIYDSRKRAPASEGDVLGIMSLGCVMENMWLMAESLGISFRIMSVFGGGSAEKEVKRILDIPKYMKIAFAVRMGYPISAPTKQLRVRRDTEDFTHHNRFGNKGLE
jgi:nitroreductase